MVRDVWGRDDELALVTHALDALPAGPMALILTGDEGIGKTTLWSAALARAEERGHRVISARPRESEARLAFAAVADLLGEGIDEVLPALPAPQRVALEAALLRVDLEGPPDPRAVAFGLSGCLRALAASGPLVIGVDDVEWLDPSSARVLEFALRRIDDVPVGVVLASRSEDADRGPLGLHEGVWEERIRHVRIGPLELDVLRRIIRARLHVRFPQWLLVQIHDASGGNPFFALELARAIHRRDVELEPGQVLPIPERLGDLVVERLDALPDPACEMLLLASAAPEPMLPSIAHAMGDEARFDRAMELALEADVVEVTRERVQFTNPLFGTVLYAAASPEERREAHRRLAEIATDPEERARHLALAAVGPDEDVAQLLEDAAQRARSHGAPDAAAELAELALVLTPDEQVAACVRRTSHAGRYAFESAHIERAEELLQEAAERASTGPARAEALLYLSRVAYHRRDSRSALALSERALEEATEDPSLQASIHLELAAGAELSGDHRTATTRARRALKLAERSGARTVTAEALSIVALYEFMSGEGFPREKLERARALQGDLPLRPLRSPAFYEACIMIWTDDLEGARTRLQDLERRARDAADESSLSILLFQLSQIASRTGAFAEASRLADESRTVAEWTGQQAYLAFALFAKALAETLTGGERAGELGEQSLAVAQQTGSVQGEGFARTVLGFLELSRDDASGTDRWLAPLVEALDGRGPADPGALRFLPDEVEALIELDQVVRAEALLSPFEARADALGRRWAQGAAARCRGLALASRRDLSGALAAFDRAEAHQQELGQPLELGRTLLARGKVLRRGKQWAPAREALTRSQAIFGGLGAPLWARKATSELARIGGRSPGPTTLTETERRVAELVATGLSNREVAARLFLSVSTVESNLRRTYRKLGIRSRGELSHRLPGPDRA